MSNGLKGLVFRFTNMMFCGLLLYLLGVGSFDPSSSLAASAKLAEFLRSVIASWLGRARWFIFLVSLSWCGCSVSKVSNCCQSLRLGKW